MFIMQVLASQLHSLANKNAELAILPLFWPVNCIKIGEHVALLSDPAVYSLYCAINEWPNVYRYVVPKPIMVHFSLLSISVV